MPDNILKAVISVVAPNVQQTATQVAGATGKMAQSFQKVAPAAKQTEKAVENVGRVAKSTIAPISKLGDSIETLRAKLLAKQQFLISEKDISKVAILNAEIRQLESEIARVKNVGVPGFDALGNAVTKTGGAFSGVVSGANGAFGVLRKIAFIIPGIGIAGLVSLLSDLVIGLFKSTDGFDAASVAAARFTIDIREAKEGVDQFVDSLDFGADIDKLKNELNLGKGAKLDIANFEIDKKKNQKIIDQANTEITELTDKILNIRSNASFVLSKKGRNLLELFPVDLDIPDNLIDELGKKDKRIINQIKVDATRIKSLEDARLKASNENAKAELESKIKARDDAKKAADKLFDDTVRQAEKIAHFLDKNTQFAVKFEVDPFDSKADTLQKAKDFIAKTKNFFEKGSASLGVFKFKPLVAVDFKFIPDEKFFSNIREQAGVLGTRTFKEVKDAFEKEVQKAAISNPLVIKTNAELEVGRKRNAEFFDALGINEEGVNKPISLLTELQKQTVNTASIINQTLVPAFNGLFSAILAGRDPLEGFFNALKSSLDQLIQKLISAALQALILSVISGGSTSFLSAFKSIAGFRAGGGPVTAGGSYIVGEKGPELFVPNTGGSIVPNNASGNFTGIQSNRTTKGSVVFEIAGNKLIGVLSNANRSKTDLV